MCKIESITSLIDTFIFIAFFIPLQYNRTRKDFDGGRSPEEHGAKWVCVRAVRPTDTIRRNPP